MTLSDDALRLLLDDGPWTAGRLAELATEVGSEDEARRLVAHWSGVETALRHRIDGLVPDRTDLVLAGLDRAGRSDLLSADERARLEERRERIAAAERESPAIADVLRAVGTEADAFDLAWAGHFASSRLASDRPALRRVRPPLRRVVARFAMAASVVAFVAVAVFVAQRDRDTTSVTATGGIRTVNLADGSSVRLMTGAELTFDAGSFDRNVTLTGRGYFNVRSDETPFRVLTPSATVTVLGTRFGVNSRPEETDVVLVEGRVAVAPPNEPDALVVLEPGQRTRVTRGEMPDAPESVDTQSALDWTRLLFFRSTPLAEVAERLETAYGVRVDVDPSLADEPFTGTFERDRGLDEVAATIEMTFEAHVDRPEPGVLRITPR